MKWDSPWGKSYPGWHLECSAIGKKFLGKHFDIHTGGVDHIPIHHENEIAQSKAANGIIPANYWMHCEFLLVDGGKMSKSLGNIYTLKELKEKGIEPLAYKLFCFSSHYRNKLNFTFDGVKAAQISLNRLREAYLKHKEGNNEIEESIIKSYENKFHEAINDDLNIPFALSIVWEVAKENNKSKDYAILLEKFDNVLGLDLINSEKYNKVDIEIPENVERLIEERKIARQEKNWVKSDEIRDKIKELGYAVKDTANGMEIEKIQ